MDMLSAVSAFEALALAEPGGWVRTFVDEGEPMARLLRQALTQGIAPGYAGPLWAEICPRSFSVLVRPGMRLNQIRFRDGHAVLDDDDLRAAAPVTPCQDPPRPTTS